MLYIRTQQLDCPCQKTSTYCIQHFCHTGHYTLPSNWGKHVYICVYMYVYAYINVYLCMYVCMYISIWLGYGIKNPGQITKITKESENLAND
jgi:hypothetical protein